MTILVIDILQIQITNYQPLGSLINEGIQFHFMPLGLQDTTNTIVALSLGS